MSPQSELDEVGDAASEWPTDPSLYELVGKIGQGAFAIVWKAKRKLETEESPTEKNLVCAVKILNLDHVDTNLAEIRLEVQAMRLLSHPNVLTCHTAFVNDRSLWLITPLLLKGSSLHALQAARRTLRRESKEHANMEAHIMYIMHETLLGLQYIHENGQIHRDIKAGNILIAHDGAVKIADFGVSGFLVQAGSQHDKARTFVGTPCWMAPEVMEQVHGYDYKADLWSLGITALELAKGYAPYAKYPPMKVLILTIQEDPPSIASYDEESDAFDDEIMCEYSRQFDSFVASCLQKNPAKRPTCPELLSTKHFVAFQDASVREARREAVRTEICSLVKDVGYKQEEAKNNRSFPGNTPVSIVLPEVEDRPKGTTWVFADGSQVLSSSAKPGEVDDVLDSLDDFGKQTGGEHYDRSGGIASAPREEDDLDQFMDEFEMNTAGENFRRGG